jgi:hypothetical protein
MLPAERELLLKSIQSRTLSPLWKVVFERLLSTHTCYQEALQEEHEALVFAKHEVLQSVLEKKAGLLLELESLEYGFKCLMFECLRSFGMERMSLVLDWFMVQGSPSEQELVKEVQALRGALRETLEAISLQGQLNASLIQHSLRYIHDLRLQLEPDLQARTQYGAKGQRASLGGASHLEQTL